jgi:hypothetical protein
LGCFKCCTCCTCVASKMIEQLLKEKLASSVPTPNSGEDWTSHQEENENQTIFFLIEFAWSQGVPQAFHVNQNQTLGCVCNRQAHLLFCFRNKHNPNHQFILDPLTSHVLWACLWKPTCNTTWRELIQESWSMCIFSLLSNTQINIPSSSK